MSPAEEALFKAFVDKASGYFEFGMGGSTVYAAQSVRGPVVAIDSDATWVESVRTLVEPTHHTRNFIHVDIGETGAWGKPVNDLRAADFPRYSSAIAGQSDVIDLCLVDGRFRVACFLQALKSLGADVVIGIHDFDSRPYYHSVLEFAREIARAEDMSFFTRRPDIDAARLENVLRAHLYDWK